MLWPLTLLKNKTSDLRTEIYGCFEVILSANGKRCKRHSESLRNAKQWLHASNSLTFHTPPVEIVIAMHDDHVSQC
jgi:hypothetical protein